MMQSVTTVPVENKPKGKKKVKPRYTKEDNEIIFQSWWNPQLRKGLAKRLGREMRALRSQFCRLLKTKDITIDQYYELMREKNTVPTGVKQPSTQQEPRGEKFSITTVVPERVNGEEEVTGAGEMTSDSFLHQLSDLPATVAGLEERVHKLEEQQKYQLDLRGFIEHLLAVERDLKKEDKLLEEIQRLVEEKENLRLLREQDLARISKRESELNEVYVMLNRMLSDFMKLESVSKLASLGNFMHNLEITVDQFGNVMKHKRII